MRGISRSIVVAVAGLLVAMLNMPSALGVAEGGGGGSCHFNSVNDYICEGSSTAPPNPFDPPDVDFDENPLWQPGEIFNQPGLTPGIMVTLPSGVTVQKPDNSESLTCEGGGGKEQFIEHLKKREGYVDHVYLDSLGKPTVCYGHLVKPGDNLSTGQKVSKEYCDQLLEQDSQWAWEAAQQQAQEAGCSDGCFIVALASVNYQLGAGWRSKFPATWNLIKNGNYSGAADNLEGSLWQKQTPVRVKDFQEALRKAQSTCGGG